MTRWLITGGCGFIGTSLIQHLMAHHPADAIRVYDNLTVGGREDLGSVCQFVEVPAAAVAGHSKHVQLIVGDIRDPEGCKIACRDIDVVVHLAANTGVGPSVADPRLDMEANVIGTFNMLEAARACGVTQFVFASSGAPLGEVEPPIHENMAPRPISPYGASKLSGEAYCSAFYRSFELRTIMLRFGNVYGRLSKHKNSVVAKFIKQALAGESLEIYGDGNQTRDFIFIDDLIQAILLGAKSKIGGEVFQIATFRETTVNEIAETLSALMAEFGKNVTVRHSKERKGDAKRNFSDISKARKVLGFNPRYELEQGLRITVEHFIKSQAPQA